MSVVFICQKCNLGTMLINHHTGFGQCASCGAKVGQEEDLIKKTDDFDSLVEDYDKMLLEKKNLFLEKTNLELKIIEIERILKATKGITLDEFLKFGRDIVDKDEKPRNETRFDKLEVD